MRISPMSLREARAFIKEKHRHHPPPHGMKFAIALRVEKTLVGCVVVGRPVSRVLDDGETAEVTRLCTDGTKNACSKLYSAANRCARAMGYVRVITYILESESGASLKASGWRFIRPAGGGDWHRASRPRLDSSPTQAKQLWEAP